MISQTGGVTLIDRHDLVRWIRRDWTHLFVLYITVVLTISLIVQIAAVTLLGGS